MSNDTDLIKREIWASLADKVRRDAFVASHLSDNIGSQIFALREARGWSQEKLATEVGMAQPRISVLEGGSDCSLRTLKRIASSFDVAVIVRFVRFGELVDWVTHLSEDRLAPVDFANDDLSEEHRGDEEGSAAAAYALVEPSLAISPTTGGSQFTSGTGIAGSGSLHITASATMLAGTSSLTLNASEWPQIETVALASMGDIAVDASQLGPGNQIVIGGTFNQNAGTFALVPTWNQNDDPAALRQTIAQRDAEIANLRAQLMATHWSSHNANAVTTQATPSVGAAIVATSAVQIGFDGFWENRNVR